MGGDVAEQSFGVSSYPASFLLDHEGKILSRNIGFHESEVPGKVKKITGLIAKKKAKAQAK